MAMVKTRTWLAGAVSITAAIVVCAALLILWPRPPKDPGFDVQVEELGELITCSVTVYAPSAAQSASDILFDVIEKAIALAPDKTILTITQDPAGSLFDDGVFGGALIYTPLDGQIRTWSDYAAIVDAANEYLASPTETIDYVPDMLKEPAEPNQEEEAPEAGVRWEIVQGKYLDLESLISEGMTLEEINAAVGVEGEKNMQVGAGTKYTWHLADGQTLVGNLEDDALVGWEVHTPPTHLVMIEPPPPKPVPPPKRGVTMEDFEWIEIGMSYEGVVRYLGVPGVLTSETQYGRHYEWKGTKPYSGASVSFTRQNGVFVVDSKYQYGLK